MSRVCPVNDVRRLSGSDRSIQEQFTGTRVSGAYQRFIDDRDPGFFSNETHMKLGGYMVPR